MILLHCKFTIFEIIIRLTIKRTQAELTTAKTNTSRKSVHLFMFKLCFERNNAIGKTL